MAGSSPPIRYIASTSKSSKQLEPARGDLYTLRSYFTATGPCDAGEKWRRTLSEMLSDNILLEIFDFYRLDAMKQSW